MRETMKKILFATTALVASAGIASAEVALSGYAELGVFENQNGTGDGFSGDATKAQVFSDIDVTFSMSGEADNGLTFGASIDLDESWQGGGNDVIVDETIGGVDVDGDGVIGTA